VLRCCLSQEWKYLSTRLHSQAGSCPTYPRYRRPPHGTHLCVYAGPIHMWAVHQLAFHREAHRGPACSSEHPTPPAMLPACTLCALHKHQQAGVGLQHHCSNALSCQAPVCSNVAVTWRHQTSNRVAAAPTFEQSNQLRLYYFACVKRHDVTLTWGHIGGCRSVCTTREPPWPCYNSPQVAWPCGSLLRSCTTEGHKQHTCWAPAAMTQVDLLLCGCMVPSCMTQAVSDTCV
jgi:hypothetical protein